MHPTPIRATRADVVAQPRSPAEQDALATVSRLQGAVAKLREAIEHRDERAEIDALSVADHAFEQLKARRGARRAA